jgi:hypothetical protein
MSYSKNKIFADSTINAVLDLMLYEIEAGLPGVEFTDRFCLSGRVAANLQGAAKGNCDNVVFITNSDEIYAFIQDHLPDKVKHTGLIKFRERTLFYFGQLYVEIWYRDVNLSPILVENIYVQPLAKIPAETL